MFYCSNCGVEIENKPNFCSSCGSDLRQEPTNKADSNVSTTVDSVQNPTLKTTLQENQSKKSSYLLISFALLFTGLGLLFFQINEYFNTQDAISTLEKKIYPISWSSGQKEADIADVRSTLSTTMLLMALGIGMVISSFVGFAKSSKQ